MSPLILLTAPECHLCEHGRGVLDELGVEWREVSIETAEGAALELAAPPMRPVLFLDEHPIAYGRLSAKRLRKRFGVAA